MTGVMSSRNLFSNITSVGNSETLRFIPFSLGVCTIKCPRDVLVGEGRIKKDSAI